MPRDTRSMKLLSNYNIGFIGAGIALVLVINALVLLHGLQAQRDSNELVIHTGMVLEEIETTFSLLKDVESGQRGYSISGDAAMLDPYNAARREIAVHLQTLQTLIGDNPNQQARLESLRSGIDERLRWLQRAVEIRRADGLNAVVAFVGTGQGIQQMNDIRRIVGNMKAEERRLMKERTKIMTDAALRADFSFWLVTVVNFLLLFMASYFMVRFSRQQREESVRLADENWLNTGVAELLDTLRGDMAPHVIAQQSLDFMARYLGIQLGSFYALRDGYLVLEGSLAGQGHNSFKPRIRLDEGLAGAAARQNRVIEMTDLQDNYFTISSTTGQAKANAVVVVPTLFENRVNGVLELATLGRLTPQQIKLLEAVRSALGSTLNTAENRRRLQDLLEETQRQAEELQAQQEELRVSNEELDAQAQTLKASQDRLQMQQEELRQTNEELEQQTQTLAAQKNVLTERNADLRRVQENLERQALELEQASRYKSEFLANMSHELRTPLNSLLILATLLSENKEGTLTEKQVDFAKTIYRAGNDLLALISDILDLSKVEAGKLNLMIEPVSVQQLLNNLDSTFRPLADKKGLEFVTEVLPNTPESIESDAQRIEQILKNLLSNAIKFTERGSVRVAFAPVKEGLEVRVTDTGIGISLEKQQQVFEAFEQADKSTSRAYGGTGLGLTISRELVKLLGGSITVSSEIDRGSTFILTLPLLAIVSAEDQKPQIMTPLNFSYPPMKSDVRSDAHTPVESVVAIIEGDVNDDTEQRILIIEDDVDFGRTLVELARDSGFKAVLVTGGEAGMNFARKNNVSAILLDIKLPDMSGLSVLERLKSDSKTRHLPIHVISGADYTQNALKLGAVGYLIKPADRDKIKGVFSRIEQVLSRKVKKVLIVEDDKMQREAIKQLLGNGDTVSEVAQSAQEAINMLKTSVYDCMILDLKLPDFSGFDLLRQLKASDELMRPPVVVYTGKDLSKDEVEMLQQYADSIIVKGVRSPERLLDEVSLFLHRLESSLPTKSQAMLQKLRNHDKSLANRKILVVDDDMRNVFALVNALDAHEVKSVAARNGKEALDKIEQDREIELVLMDIMMPVMDGFEAMSAIRSNPEHRRLPIIALTAKAMKGDLERCLAAGANDYLPKPLNLERLISLLKVWLPQRHE